jgi:glucokinase
LIDQFTTFINNRSWGLQGVGVAIPGIVYRQNRTVWAPNIKGWEQFPLEENLRSYLPAQVPIIIDNDRACYILGEMWQGAAQGCSHAIYLGVGTGIGAGILIDNVVLRGQNDIAGAIGWMALTDQYLPQYGEHGCFEHHASGSGIAGMAIQAFAQSGRPTEAISTASVFEMYQQQDPIAQQILDQAIKFWGMAVANLVSLFNPEKIIFGGGVFGPGLDFLEDIYQQATGWAQPISIKQVKLVKSGLAEEAGLYGAGYLVKDLADQS